MYDEFAEKEGENGGNKKSIQCSNCRKKIELGFDLVIVEKGVLGPRGPIPLSEPIYFCSESCVSNYYNGVPDEDLDKLPPRIP